MVVGEINESSSVFFFSAHNRLQVRLETSAVSDDPPPHPHDAMRSKSIFLLNSGFFMAVYQIFLFVVIVLLRLSFVLEFSRCNKYTVCR